MRAFNSRVAGTIAQRWSDPGGSGTRERVILPYDLREVCADFSPEIHLLCVDNAVPTVLMLVGCDLFIPISGATPDRLVLPIHSIEGEQR